MSRLSIMEYKIRLKRVLIPLAFILAACTPDSSDSPTLRLAGVNYLGDLPTLVASKNQLFRKQHLNIQVTFNESGKQSLEDLRMGKVDFALMDPTTFMLDKLANVHKGSQENKPVILGNLLHSTLMNQILASFTDTDIQVVTDLKGRRIGLTKGTSGEYLWWLYTVFYQVETDEIEVIDLAPKDLGKALIDGEVDAIVVWQPWTNHFIAEYGDKIKQVKGSHVYSAKWLLVTNQKMVKQNPEYCQRLLKAYAEAISVIHIDTENVMGMYTDEMNKNNLIGEHYQPDLYQLNLNWSLISELHQGIQWAKLNHFPGSENETDVTSWFAPEPLRAIQPFSVKIPTLNHDGKQP